METVATWPGSEEKWITGWRKYPNKGRLKSNTTGGVRVNDLPRIHILTKLVYIFIY
jgi:hypothetical protein